MLLVLNLISGAIVISSLPTNANNSTGYAIIKVLESNTLAPVGNATICIVETKTYYQTDKYGYSSKIEIPIVPNKNFDISLKRNWGDFTLIVYKPGYSTLVSYYNQVLPHTTNAGIVCFLHPIINPSDPSIIVESMSPGSDYTKALVDLYLK
ncbi:MAG: hypothetical protein IJ542_02690 [Clostridia bacterium]|nr:hypothetical protein [Clostridia bacterium]